MDSTLSLTHKVKVVSSVTRAVEHGFEPREQLWAPSKELDLCQGPRLPPDGHYLFRLSHPSPHSCFIGPILCFPGTWSPCPFLRKFIFLCLHPQRTPLPGPWRASQTWVCMSGICLLSQCLSFPNSKSAAPHYCSLHNYQPPRFVT